jgi:4-amino-4-deoxy-L-arabinose transferase-like glycosyltransferase
LVVAIGRMIMTDSILLFFFTAAMLTYWESLVGNPRWRLLTAACLGSAVLAKGPVALILFVAIAGWTAFGNRGSRTSDRGSGIGDRGGNEVSVWITGTLILLAIIASWYVPAYLANGQTFVSEFLIKQNLGRFTGGDSAHTLPFLKSFWFYIPILLVGMFPWILWLPGAWPRANRGSRTADRGSALRSYLAGWAGIIFVFFTISGAKLPHYVLPCAPPIAILVGWCLAEKWTELSREQIRPKLVLKLCWLIASWIIVQGGFEFWYSKSGQAEAHSFARYIKAQNLGKDAPVAVYQLPRRTHDLGTGKAKIQETSLPSVSFYADQDLVETDKLSDLEAGPKPIWIFTRVGRISDAEVQESVTSGPHYLQLIRTGDFYQVFLLH